MRSSVIRAYSVAFRRKSPGIVATNLVNLKKITRSSPTGTKNNITMGFDTKILTVKPESVHFGKNDVMPTITDKQTEDNIRLAANELVHTTNCVGFPTETVYGLAGSALNDDSVRSIYRAKNRPADNPLIVHVSSLDQLKRKLAFTSRL